MWTGWQQDLWLIVFFCCKQRSSEFHRLKMICIRQNILFHKIIFHTVHYMSRLNDHICNSILFHTLHCFCHIVIVNMISLFNSGENHFAGPCAINFTICKSSSNFFFNRINSHCSGIFMTGTKADYKDPFFCCIAHSDFLHFSFIFSHAKDGM